MLTSVPDQGLYTITDWLQLAHMDTGPYLWTSLNEEVQSSRIKSTFKRRITQNYRRITKMEILSL